MSSSDPCGCDGSKRETLELSAWRYLAAHRVGTLSVTHVTFISSNAECRVNTPSFEGFYESANGATFSEAAIELAIALGMQCSTSNEATDCPTSQNADADGSSSAPTATRHSGEKSKTSPRTRSRKTGEIIDATSVEADTGGSAEQR